MGQVKFEAAVDITSPLDGLICSYNSGREEPPVVSSRLTNRLPLGSNASPASVNPKVEVVLSGVRRPRHPQHWAGTCKCFPMGSR